MTHDEAHGNIFKAILFPLSRCLLCRRTVVDLKTDCFCEEHVINDDAQDKRAWDTLKLNGDSKVARAIRQQIQVLVLHGAVSRMNNIIGVSIGVSLKPVTLCILPRCP